MGLLIAVDVISQKRDLRQWLVNLPLAAQWLIYLGGIAVVAVFGVYGPEYETAPFIYFQF